MQRYNSKSSITSIGSSSRAGEKKPPPTHMIIQREHDNKMILLPTTHLVNSSVARIKLNDMATFKIVLNNRKQERGRVLQLGNKEECTEQLQIFEMTADVDLYEKTSDAEDDDNKEEERSVEKQFNKAQESSKKPSTASFHDRSRTSSITNRKTSLSSNKSQTTDDGKKQKEILKLKYSQIDEEQENEIENDSEEDFDNTTSNECFDDNLPMKQISEKQTTKYVQKHQAIPSSKKLSNKQKDHDQFVSQSEITIDVQSKDMSKYVDNGKEMCQSIIFDENDLSQLNCNDIELMRRFKKVSKQYEEERAKNIALENENKRLFEEIQILKRTTIPMPDPAGRRWIIDTGKRLDGKDRSVDIQSIAKALKITEVRDLIKCIEGTTTSTARQVVKLLFPRSVLETESGEIVSPEQRELIRTFAVSQRGPVQDHAFTEAINGVFRSARAEAAKAEKLRSQPAKTNGSNQSNKSIHKGQKTLTEMMEKTKKTQLSSSSIILGKENKRDKANHEEHEE